MLALKDIKKRKRQDKAWEKIFKKYISDKGLAGRLYFFKKTITTNNKTKNNKELI